MRDLSASIVAYRNEASMIAQAIHSFLSSTTDSKLFLIDNSPTDNLKYLAYDPRIVYVFNNKNLGFGAAHNIALQQVLNVSKYHLILNPDVYFDNTVVRRLYDFMNDNKDIGQVMPKVLYPDGRIQHLCKLLPTPETLILRRFLNFLTKRLEKKNFEYEFQFSNYDTIMDVPFLSGCFMFLRMDALKKVGLFDERFFLYTEDTDLTRRIHQCFRTVFYPDATIFHHHARGSYKDPRLLWLNIQSAIRYFNKWGWFNDAERTFINQKVLLRFSN
jgi:GT2 family glycosyltransferase